MVEQTEGAEVVASGRPLGAVERVFEWMNLEGMATHVVIARIAHDPGDEALEAGLRHVQATHPTLRATLGTDAQGVWRFRPETAPGVRLERDGRLGLEVAQEALQVGLDAGRGPLWRAVRSSDGAVVLILHHAIEDGLSTVAMLNQALAVAGQVVAGQEPSTPTSRPWRPTLEAQLGGRLGWKAIWQMLAREGFRRLFKPRMVLDEPEAALERRVTRVSCRRLDPEVTRQLVARCREEQTTMQGALSAAMLLSARARLGGQAPAWMTCDANVSLRHRCEPPADSDEVGMFIGSLTWMYRVRPDDDLWALAREVRARLTQLIERDEPIHNMLVIDWIGMQPQWLADFARRGHARQQTVFVSNLGRVASPPQGQPRLASLHYTMGQHGMGACFWLGVATLDGALDMTFTHVEPLVSPQTAEAFIQGTLDALERAAAPRTPLLTPPEKP